MLIGNAVADALADGAAGRHRIASSVRARIFDCERKVGLVRRRLLRATLDAAAAEKAAGREVRSAVAR
eukprot:8314791-Pyramimonas_sp.AAC.1